MNRLALMLTRPAAYRGFLTVFGFALVPLYHSLIGTAGSILQFVGFYALALVGLRFGPGLMRRVIRFSPETLEVWMRQRVMAKRYDSYQWRKQFWIGLGMALNGLVAASPPAWHLPFAITCTVFGWLGWVAWRRRLKKLQAVLIRPSASAPMSSLASVPKD